jgi:hypothetical protein
VQLVTLENQNTNEKISIGCFVQVGNPYGMEAIEWRGSADMSFANTGSVKFDEMNESERVPKSDSKVHTLDDPDFYARQDSELDPGLNWVQNCQAKMSVDKLGSDSDIFAVYNAQLQARIYDTSDSTSPINLGETSFEIELKAPVVEAEEFDPYDETWVDEYENEFFIMHEEYMSSWKPLSNGIDSEFKQSVWIDRWDNKEYTRPDVLEITFTSEGSSEKLANDTIVFSWAQFNKVDDTSGTKQTVACATKIGQDEPEFYVFNYVGSSEWGDNLIAQNTNISELKTDEPLDATTHDPFRQTYNDWDYTSW